MFAFRDLEKGNLTREDRKAIKSRTNRFWLIAFNLLRNSEIFRVALLNKTMSKKGW